MLLATLCCSVVHIGISWGEPEYLGLLDLALQGQWEAGGLSQAHLLAQGLHFLLQGAVERVQLEHRAVLLLQLSQTARGEKEKGAAQAYALWFHSFTDST